MIQSKHHHGGQLQVASEKYKIPLQDWIDLSTGINPTSYPLPDMPTQCWQRLPEMEDGLETAAANYYGSQFLLPVSGSQEAIQRLPLLFPIPQKIGIIKPAYHSHQQAWEKAGHSIVTLNSSEVSNAISSLDILLLVNPTNPSTETFSTDQLLAWHHQLTRHNGMLIVDEAFMDSTLEGSLITQTPKKGLVVLRSIGKFFGLAGIRLGFVWGEETLLKKLADLQDDWSVSHPARWAGKLALTDTHWQKSQQELLPLQAQALSQLLASSLMKIAQKRKKRGGCVFKILKTSLFCYLQHPDASKIYHLLAQQGILTRLFNDPSALRFGLPANEQEFKALAHALQETSKVI